jgi:lysophospholipase L1-like esterase
MALLASLTFAICQAHATNCPVPDEFTLSAGDLPATVAAIAKRNLTILAIGGAATLGGSAGGQAFTYPARLEARLRAAFPSVTIDVAIGSVPRESDAILFAKLDASLAALKPALVIWGPGGGAAARGDDLDTFTATVTDVIGRIRSAGADPLLMTLQYAPSVSRIVNLFPYKMAVVRAGEDAGAPVLDRYELMRFWSDSGFMDLDATDAADRIRVSRTLYDCIGEILTKGIVDAAK